MNMISHQPPFLTQRQLGKKSKRLFKTKSTPIVIGGFLRTPPIGARESDTPWEIGLKENILNSFFKLI